MEHRAKKKPLIWLATGLATVAALAIVFVFVILPLLKDKDDPTKSRLFVIESVSIQYEGATVTSLDPIAYGEKESLAFTVVINGGAAIDTNKYDQPTVTWSFVDNTLNNTVTNGLVDLSETALGEATVRVTVTSENTRTADVAFSITALEDSTLTSIEITIPPITIEEGSPFIRDGMVVEATFQHASGEYTVEVQDYTVSPSGPLTKELLGGSSSGYVTISYTHDAVEKSEQVWITLSRTLVSISVVQPTKSTYFEGETLDLTGMKVIAHYLYIEDELSSGEYSIVFNLADELKLSNTSIKVFHIQSGLEATLNLTINYKTVTSLDVTGYRTNYIFNQRFDVSGLIVKAQYNYGSTQVVSNYSVNKTNGLTMLDDGTDIVISYTERGATVTYKVRISVTLPYAEENLRLIKIDGNPLDVRLTWILTYPGDNGDETIDYLTYEEQQLLYNPATGEYKVPQQAIVTISKINPSITDFFLDGTAQFINQSALGFDFVVGAGEDDIIISYEKVDGDRITLRFVDEEHSNTLILYFSVNWTGRILSTHLERITFRFFETETIAYEYRLDGNLITLADFDIFEKVKFDEGTSEEVEIDVYFLRLFAYAKGLTDITITVKMVDREVDEKIEVTLISWEGLGSYEITMKVSQEDYLQTRFLAISRDGYSFKEWEKIDDTTFRAVWVCNYGIVDYSSEDIVGTWSKELEDFEFYTYSFSLTYSFTFNADGTYIIKGTVIRLFLDGTEEQDEYNLFGIYRIEDGEIVIKTIGTEWDYYVTDDTEDLAFELIDDSGNLTLKANLFLVLVLEIEEEIEIEEGVFETVKTLALYVEIFEEVLE